MLTHNPNQSSSSPSTFADQHEYGDRSASLCGQLILLAILALAALMRLLR